MFTFGRIGQSFHWNHRWAVCCASSVVIACLLAGGARAQSSAICDAVPCPAPAPSGLADASYLSPLLQTLYEWEPLTELCPGSQFLWSEGSIWIEHIAGGGPGWDPYTGLGGSLPLGMENGVLLFEGQIVVTNEGRLAQSLGLHRRFFIGHQLVGVGGWYDLTQSPNENLFHQLSTSLEWFPAEHWTVRLNGYMPLGTRTEHLQTVPGTGLSTIDFSGNNLISSTHVATRLDDAAMRGYDIEAARNLGTWTGEVFVGYYNYHGDIGGSTDGVKAGVRGYLTPRLAGSITVSDDQDFSTNVFGGITWYFGGRGAKAPRSLCDKVTLPVERNPQIVINRAVTRIFDGEVLNDAVSGMPITVSHVGSQGGGSNMGTFENPFIGLPATQMTDIVYVHGNSTFDSDSYVMSPGQSFLGEGDGNTHQVNTMQLGMVTLPAGSGGANRPVIQNTPLGIELDDDATVSNLRITDAQIGLHADGAGGNITIDETIITNPADTGLFVENSSATINFGGNSTITQTTGPSSFAALISNDTGVFNFAADSVIDATDGQGIGFTNADGQYNFAGTVTLNGGESGISIVNGSNGDFTFGPNTSVTVVDDNSFAFNVTSLGSMAQIDFNGSLAGTAGGGDLINIGNTAAGSIINFNMNSANSIAGNGAGGITILSANGNVTFTTPVTIQNPIENSDAAGVSITGGSGNISFSNLSVTLPAGGFDAAVEIENHAGSITLNNLDLVTNGSGTIGLFGQMINNLTVGGTSSIDSTGGAAVQVGGATLINMTFSDITVTNSEDGIGFGNGISLGTIAGGTFDVTGTTSVQGATDMGRRGILIAQSTGTFTFADIDIANTNGEGIAVFGMGGGGVNATGTTTVTNAGTHGILINDSTGTFTFADVDIDVTGGDGLAIGTPSGNPGTVNINGGTVNGTMGNGATVLNALGFNLNDTIFTNNTGATISLTGSTVSGMGNIAPLFSSIDGGGNAGMILFNGGADMAP